MLRVSLVLLICLFTGRAYSNPPLPTPPKAEQKNQADTKDKQQPTSTDQRGTEGLPLFIKVVPSLSVEPSPAEHTQQSNGYTSPEWWLVWVTLILAFITAILAAYTAKLWGATKSLAEDAKQTADRQTSEMQASLRVAQESADAALETAKSIETANRAFVKMSHLPPGLVFNAMGGTSVQMRVKNFGKTPARIVDVLFDFKCIADVASIPANPPIIETRSQGSAFLVEGDEFFFSRQHALGAPEMDNLQGGKGTVLVWGHIDYIDAFDQRHRAGYGRIYNYTRDAEYDGVSPEDFKQRSNLNYVTSAAYNYDRPYKDGQDSKA